MTIWWRGRWRWRDAAIVCGGDTTGSHLRQSTTTPFEEDAGESFAERTTREQPDPAVDELDRPTEPSPDEPGIDVGQLVDPHATTLDDEAKQVADALPAAELDPEEAAMHVEDDSD